MQRRSSEQSSRCFILGCVTFLISPVLLVVLIGLLAQAGFDAWGERLCEPYYDGALGHPSISAGHVLPYAARGLLRGNQLAAGDRLAVLGQPLAAGIPGTGHPGGFARPLLAHGHPHTPYRTYIRSPSSSGSASGPTSRQSSGQPSRPIGGEPQGARGKRRLRSELLERTFAHMCETGGAWRTWLWGLEKVRERCAIAAAAHNLGLVMRKLFGMETPRCLQGLGQALRGLATPLQLALLTPLSVFPSSRPTPTAPIPPSPRKKELPQPTAKT
jgi:hypothetical protein